MTEHRNTKAGYCETWDTIRPHDQTISFPNHPWDGDDAGHNCAGCAESSEWRCDRVAHNLGEFQQHLAATQEPPQ